MGFYGGRSVGSGRRLSAACALVARRPVPAARRRLSQTRPPSSLVRGASPSSQDGRPHRPPRAGGSPPRPSSLARCWGPSRPPPSHRDRRSSPRRRVVSSTRPLPVAQRRSPDYCTPTYSLALAAQAKMTGAVGESGYLASSRQQTPAARRQTLLAVGGGNPSAPFEVYGSDQSEPADGLLASVKLGAPAGSAYKSAAPERPPGLAIPSARLPASTNNLYHFIARCFILSAVLSLGALLLRSRQAGSSPSKPLPSRRGVETLSRRFSNLGRDIRFLAVSANGTEAGRRLVQPPSWPWRMPMGVHRVATQQQRPRLAAAAQHARRQTCRIVPR